MSEKRRLGYLPWMDGMRGAGFLAIMMFHEVLGQPTLGLQRWFASEGFPVDMFFVISGFLITTLLLQEVRDRNGIRFGAFYLRRARRLLPAMLAILAILVVAALVWDHGHARTVLLQRVGITLVYSTNWVTALSHFNLQVLNHTWSLADEEQFYLLWPLILTGIVLLGRRFSISQAAAKGTLVIATATVVWLQWATYRHWSYDRIYYGLDTRSTGLAIGSLLGALWVSGLLPTSRPWVIVRRGLGIIGGVALLELFHNGEYFVQLAHHVGFGMQRAEDETFLIAGIATVLIMWELAESAPHIGHRILSIWPLVAVGRISYGLYLWDSVVVVELTPALTGLHGWPLIWLHIAATFAAAILSWFVIERPFRSRRPRGGTPPLPQPSPGGRSQEASS